MSILTHREKRRSIVERDRLRSTVKSHGREIERTRWELYRAEDRAFDRLARMADMVKLAVQEIGHGIGEVIGTEIRDRMLAQLNRGSRRTYPEPQWRSRHDPRHMLVELRIDIPPVGYATVISEHEADAWRERLLDAKHPERVDERLMFPGGLPGRGR